MSSNIESVVAEYLRDDGGMSLELSAEQYANVQTLMQRSAYEGASLDLVMQQNAAISNQINASTTHLSNQIGMSTEAVINSVRAVGGMVAESFAVTMEKLDQIDANIAQIGGCVNAVSDNVVAVARDLAELRRNFYDYVEEDRKVQAIQQATSDMTNIRLELERRFGSHDRIRKNTVGILRARDLGVIQTSTIISETEKNLLNAPDYWLASALIALAHWIDASTGKKSGLAQRNATKALNEAFRLDRQKTSLLFGLINLRAGKREEAAHWFGTYLSFQRPEKVDHTMTLLLNVCSSGVLVGTEANDLVIGQLSSWIDEIDRSSGRQEIVEFWQKVALNKCATADIKQDRFPAIAACCPSVANNMNIALSGAYLHGIMRNDIETKLAQRDIVEEETWAQIDEMLYSLTGNFAGEELPLRRDFEYNKLIIDLGGNARLAQGLRSIKNEVLSESKKFIDIMNHAAYDSGLASASAATAAMAIRLEMPWIKEGYKIASEQTLSMRPNVIPITLGGFNAQTTDGTNEQEIVKEFSSFIEENERKELTAAAATPLHMGLAIGGGVAAVIGIIMFLAGSFLGALLLIGGLAACGFGVSQILKARKSQAAITERMKHMRRNGILALREVCAEIREWTKDFDAHQADQIGTESYMDQIIKESVEAAAFAASCR